MAVKTVTTWIRPNRDVLFYQLDPAWLDYHDRTYIQTGLRISTSKEISPDKLSLKITTVWKDMAAVTQFREDPQTVALLFEPRVAYNEAHSIVYSPEDPVEI